MRRLALLVLLFISGLWVHPAAAQTETGVQLVVLTGDDRPVAGLALTVVDDTSATHTLITDAKGSATVQTLPASFFRITNAQQPDGTAVSIEATTLDEGLRLGLIPNQTRTVLLRLDSNLLFVDPDTIFSGTDTEDTIATAEALTVSAPTSVVANLNGGTDAGEIATAAQGADAPRPSRSPFVVAVALSILLPLGLFAARALLQSRRQKGRTA